MSSRKNVLVSLSAEECRSAAMLGATRRIDSKLDGLKDNHGLGKGADAWGMDIEGALSEMALAKALGVYFDPTVGTFKGPDVAGVQVRSTTHKAGSLIVRPDDPGDDAYVLVISDMPRFRLVGWMRGRDAKDEKYLSQKGNARRPAYFVPQKDLLPFRNL